MVLTKMREEGVEVSEEIGIGYILREIATCFPLLARDYYRSSNVWLTLSTDL